MKTRGGYNKIVNYMTAGAEVPVLACGHTAYQVKMHYPFQNLLYSWSPIRQSIKQINFHIDFEICGSLSHGSLIRAEQYLHLTAINGRDPHS